MKNNHQKLFGQNWGLRVISLVLAILLFAYVEGSNSSSTRSTTRSEHGSALMSERTETLRVPLELNADSEKYVVTGYPQYVHLRITGPAALVTTTSNTRNFKVYLDLDNLSTGTHRVKVKASGLNKELDYKINPAKITVNIQARSTATVPVEVKLNSRRVAEGYHVGTPSASLNRVQITGASDEVQRVAKVVAAIDVPKSAKSSLRQTVTLQAVDRNNQTMNVVVMPASVSVTVPISADESDSSSRSSDSDDNISNTSSRSRAESTDESSSTVESSNAESLASESSSSRGNNSTVSTVSSSESSAK